MTKKSMTVLNNQAEFLRFLKSRYPVYHLSNFFFRDLQYGVAEYLGKKGVDVKYGEAERIAREIGGALERQNIFRKINPQGWVIHYPEFSAQKAS